MAAVYPGVRLRRRPPSALELAVLLAAGAALAAAHGGNDAGGGHMDMGHPAETLPEDAPLYRWPEEPMDWALRAHLVLGLVGYVVVLPIALVMEVAGHKYQGLAQLGGALVAFLGIVFGCVAGNVHNAYARFGWFMVCLLVLQTALSLGLTLGAVKRTPLTQWLHRGAGIAQLVVTYIAMILGVIRYLNLCSQTALGQCVSHFARGSTLVVGSVVLLVLLRLLGAAMVGVQRPIEFYVSALMMAVGLIGTFTEHNFLQPAKSDQASGAWSHKDLQHTMIGISWFAAGLLGMLMAWNSHPRNRNVVPAITFIATGIAMIIHQQDLAMSSQVHFLFGASLVCLGLTTIGEITLLGAGVVDDYSEPAPFQYVTVLFMCSSGISLMGANRDMILLLINSQIEAATYALILLSLSFVVVLYFYLLIDLYRTLAGPPSAKYRELGDSRPDPPSQRFSESSQGTTLSQPRTPLGLTPATLDI